MSSTELQKQPTKRPTRDRRRTVWAQSNLSFIRNSLLQKSKPCAVIDVIHQSLNLLLQNLMNEISKRVETQKVTSLRQYVGGMSEMMMGLDLPIKDNVRMSHNNQEQPPPPAVHHCGSFPKVIRPILKRVPEDRVMFDTFHEKKNHPLHVPESYKTTMGLMKYPESKLQKLEECVEEEEEPYKSFRLSVKYPLPQVKVPENSSTTSSRINLRGSLDDEKQNNGFKKKQRSNVRASEYISSGLQKTISQRTQGMFRSKLTPKTLYPRTQPHTTGNSPPSKS